MGGAGRGEGRGDTGGGAGRGEGAVWNQNKGNPELDSQWYCMQGPDTIPQPRPPARESLLGDGDISLQLERRVGLVLVLHVLVLLGDVPAVMDGRVALAVHQACHHIRTSLCVCVCVCVCVLHYHKLETYQSVLLPM